ncbi:MAG: (2Fe-2S)-binding protein [Planctomycetales bacterium]|nr:(2Fe-2S)-binding protein [Planctomycetales bacterium]
MSDSLRGPDPSAGVSRRSFLQGSGAAAAVAGMASGVAQAAEDAAGVGLVEGVVEISLDVNGQSRNAKVEPRTTLLEVLRYQFGLTGAKPVSNDGTSGASTVLVDGKPVMASTTLALAARGKKIQTVESLGGDKPDAVVQAFVKHDAQQCGFCTPGFVMAARAFLDKHPRATEDEIRKGLGGNICRCGTYANVIQAAVAIAKEG